MERHGILGTKTAKTAAALLCLSLAGCANSPRTPQDPWEGFNRASFAFNKGFDEAVGKPVAKTYAKAPQPARDMVSNFFSNLAEPWSALNHLASAEPKEALASAGRFLLNTTIGAFGFFDPATRAGIERKPQDFGQTLGKWGAPAGPYLVLPLLGPSSLRDAAALPLDARADPVFGQGSPMQEALAAIRAIDVRSGLLGASDWVEQTSIDPYSFIREAYLARRAKSIAKPDADDGAEPAP